MVSFPPLINMLKFGGLSPRGRGPDRRHRQPPPPHGTQQRATSAATDHQLIVRARSKGSLHVPPLLGFGHSHGLRPRLELSVPLSQGCAGRSPSGPDGKRAAASARWQDVRAPRSLSQDGGTHSNLRERQAPACSEARRAPHRATGRQQTPQQQQPASQCGGRGGGRQSPVDLSQSLQGLKTQLRHPTPNHAAGLRRRRSSLGQLRDGCVSYLQTLVREWRQHWAVPSPQCAFNWSMHLIILRFTC